MKLLSVLSSHQAFRRLFEKSALRLLSCLLILTAASCGGGGSSPPPNVGGGYTLQVAGGTLNDGSGTSGLVVLATLRDDAGRGPTSNWTLSITGPGIDDSAPLVVEYTDYLPGSYMSWEWAEFDPIPGTTYRATAMNAGGTVTLRYTFAVASSTLQRPIPGATPSTNSISLSWSSINNAHSYSYEVCSPSSKCVSGLTTTPSATADFSSFGSSLETGDHLVRIRAYSSDRKAISDSASAAPPLASPENVSDYSFSCPVNGDPNAASYALNAAVGVMDFGLRGPGNTPINGLTIWTSIRYNNAAPAGNWNVTVTDPSGYITNYLYPAAEDHHLYWYYGIEPLIGTYTITANYGSVTKSTTVTLSSTTSSLVPLTASSITATGQINGDRLISWSRVSGAGSYYASIWSLVWNKTSHQFDYLEVWEAWVKDPGTGTAASVTAAAADAGFSSGMEYDVYISAAQYDMASSPGATPSRVDMSENYNPKTFLVP